MCCVNGEDVLSLRTFDLRNGHIDLIKHFYSALQFHHVSVAFSSDIDGAIVM